MQINSENIKDYLNLVKDYKYQAASCGNKLQEIESRAKQVTAQLTGMPRGSGSDTDGKFASYVFDVENARKDLEKWSKASENIKKRVQYFIFDMPLSDREKAILYRRYICLDTPDEVFRRINKSEGLSYDYVGELHRRAIKLIADYVNTTGKYKEEIEYYVYGSNRAFTEGD